MSKAMTVRATIAAILAGLSLSTDVLADAVRQIDVPAGELVGALETLSRQAAIDLVFQPDKLKSFRTEGVSGTYSPQDAIRILLKGTPFELRTDASSGAMVIVPPAAPTASSLSWSRLHLAQAASAAPGEGRGEVTTDERVQRAQSSQVIELEEIVIVTGTQIRGISNNTAPVTILDRGYIDSTGISTATRLIESLPQNFATTNQSTTSGSETAGPLEQGSAANLRGIGEGTTLVLVNGRRLAPNAGGASVNVSALPLSAIERVEVLTDGASALYGSDAVGGVINFILRSDYEGAETRLRYGSADDVDEYRVGQTLGTAWGSGNVLVAGEYYSRGMLASGDRDWVPDTSLIGSLLPEDENYSFIATANQDISESISLFGDVLYTHRDSYNEGGVIGQRTWLESPQLSAAVGLKWRLPGDWQIQSHVAHAQTEADVSLIDTSFSFFYDNRFVTQSAALKADGSLFSLPGGPARAAIGVDWRGEEYEQSGTSGLRQNDQTVRSIYAEAYLPMFGAENAIAGIERLELSLAGRYDEYSNFGSSFDPRIGLMWEPVAGLRLRGSWGTAYLAPRLSDYTVGFNSAAAFYFTDPGSATGTSHILQIGGIDVAGLTAQDAKTMSIGIDFAPSSAPGLRLGLNYYQIDYRNRIADLPGSPDMLAAPGGFADLIVRDPTVAQVNEYIAIGALSGNPLVAFDPFFMPDADFDPSTVDVIVDIRRRNLSVTKTRGLDFLAQYEFAALGGDVQLGLAGTYIFELSQQTTPTAASIDRVGTYGSPSRFRARASLGWRRGGWSANTFVNYVDSYTDNRGPSVDVSSYTIVDGRIAYRFDGDGGFSSGLTLGLSVQNFLDRDPPSTRILSQLSDMGFDPTNANPMGRLVAIELTKEF